MVDGCALFTPVDTKRDLIRAFIRPRAFLWLAQINLLKYTIVKEQR